jgi:SLOG cluster3 family
MRAVFLSASIPLPERDAKYFVTADVVAIRDCIRALVSVVIPSGQIVFGGHPAITPLIRLLVENMNATAQEHITLYLSRFFEHVFPPESKEFEQIRLVDSVPNDREASLAQLRTTMLTNHEFDAGIFIGGMEGVEAEFGMFRKLQPAKPAYPIASTGAAARVLHEKYMPDRQDLSEDLLYLSLFRRLLRP